MGEIDVERYRKYIKFIREQVDRLRHTDTIFFRLLTTDFSWLYTSLSDSLRYGEGSGFCIVERDWDGPNIVCYTMTNEDLGLLGSTRLVQEFDYVDFECRKETGRPGEMYIELWDSWVQNTEKKLSDYEAQKSFFEAQSEPPTGTNRDIDDLIAKILDKLSDRNILAAIESEMEEAERQRDALTYLKLMRYKERLLKISPAQPEPPTKTDRLEQADFSEISKELKKIINRTDINTLKEEFHNLWGQRVPVNRLRLQLAPYGFYIYERYEDDHAEHQRGEVLFFPVSNGNPQIEVMLLVTT